MKTLLSIFAFLILASTAGAQAYRFDSQVSQAGPAIAGVGTPVVIPANPVVVMCNSPANAVPCSNKATTYTDSTGTTPCPTSTQIVLVGTTTCVTNPDAQNNWGVWLAAGSYAYTITLPNGSSIGPYDFTIGAAGGGAGNPCIITPYSIQINQSSAFGCSNLTVDSATRNNLTIPGTNLVGGNETVTASQYVGGPTPWIDLQAPPYYARPLNATANPNTTGTSPSTSTSLTVASATGWQKNDGVVVSTAGAATTQSTPAAPTVTPLGVVGTSTISYECVGADSLEGLTAASPAGSTTTAPLFFGEVPIAISSISRASNVVTVTTGANMPVSSGTYHAMIWNVTWPSGVWDGLEAITVTSATSFTYSQTGADETGTVTSGKTKVWLSNAFIATSITRTNSSSMVITTDVNHDIAVGTAQYPMVVNVSGILPLDMDGTFRVTAVGSNMITVATGFYFPGTETGTLNYGNSGAGGFKWNQMGVYAWESNLVSCPALSGSTQDYYIYADYTASGTYSLIGATVPGQIKWRDWGLFLNGTGTGVINVGYTPPPAAAVPATAPSSAQNQEYVGTITNVSGTTFTVTPTIPTGVTGQNVYHDQSIAIKAASDAACGARAGIVYFSGPETISAPSGYVVNAPFNVTSNSSCRGLTGYGGAPLTLNDTLTDNMFGGFNIQAFSNGDLPSGASATYWTISGLGNPLLNSWSSSSCVGGCQLHVDHVQFTTNGNAQVGVESGGAYSTFKSLYTSSNGTSVGLHRHGPFVNTIHNLNAGGFPVYGFTTIGGQSPTECRSWFGLSPTLKWATMEDLSS